MKQTSAPSFGGVIAISFLVAAALYSGLAAMNGAPMRAELTLDPCDFMSLWFCNDATPSPAGSPTSVTGPSSEFSGQPGAGPQALTPPPTAPPEPSCSSLPSNECWSGVCGDGLACKSTTGIDGTAKCGCVPIQEPSPVQPGPSGLQAEAPLANDVCTVDDQRIQSVLQSLPVSQVLAIGDAMKHFPAGTFGAVGHAMACTVGATPGANPTPSLVECSGDDASRCPMNGVCPGGSSCRAGYRGVLPTPTCCCVRDGGSVQCM